MQTIELELLAGNTAASTVCDHCGAKNNTQFTGQPEESVTCQKCGKAYPVKVINLSEHHEELPASEPGGDVSRTVHG